jgi:hypothetical protein
MIDDYDMLHDLFAAFALAGIVTRGETTNQYDMARDAYKIAEAMMFVRAENEQL